MMERVCLREIEYDNVKKGTEKCSISHLNYGVSFYGAAKIKGTEIVKYKRIEVWCPSCPSANEFARLHKFFTKYVPVKNNTVFAYVASELFEVKP